MGDPFIDGGHDDDSTNWLHFGTPSSWANVGITFDFSNAPTIQYLPGITYGRYFVVQIINYGDIKKNYLIGTNLYGLEKNYYGLDSDYPFQSLYDEWHSFGYSERTNDNWFDVPASGLDQSTWLSRTDSFTAYLMFQFGTLLDPYTNNLPVPMYSATWSWSGVVETNSSPTGYYLYSSTPPSPNVYQTSNFPIWNINVTNFMYQTNLIPFNEN